MRLKALAFYFAVAKFIGKVDRLVCKFNREVWILTRGLVSDLIQEDKAHAIIAGNP